MTSRLAAFLFAMAGALTAQSLPSSEGFGRDVQPILTQVCAGCHNDRVASSGLDISGYLDAGSLVSKRTEWEEILGRVRAGEMPPADATRPSAASLAAMTSFLEAEFNRQDRSAKPDPGRVTAHRLNRAEYTNTIRDLLGVATSVLVLSAPATSLARAMDLQGAKELFRQRVKRLVIVDSAATASDPLALQKVAAEWPGPVFFCGRDVGEMLPFPGSRLETLFTSAATHPVADAYRAFQPMPYDAPCQDLAALYFAVHPEVNFFQTSEPGSVAVNGATGIQFSTTAGNVKRITVDPGHRDAAIAALTAIATAASGSGAPRGGG